MLNAGKDATGFLTHCQQEYESYSNLEKCFKGSCKTKHILTIQPSNYILGYLSQGNKNIQTYTEMLIAYLKQQKPGNNPNVLQQVSGYINTDTSLGWNSQQKREKNIDTCDNLDESQGNYAYEVHLKRLYTI